MAPPRLPDRPDAAWAVQLPADQRRGSPECDGPGKDAGPRAEKAPAIARVRHGHEDRGRTTPLSDRG